MMAGSKRGALSNVPWPVLLLILLLANACLTGSPGPDSAPQPRLLRVLTYNIHHGEGMDGRFDYDRLARVIARAKPDLVALQEVDVGTGRASGKDQPAELAKRLAMHPVFGEAMPYDGGAYGEAVLSRFPPKAVANHPLSCSPGQEPRAALAVEVRPWGEAGPAVLFAGTHLCHQSGETRLRQAREIRAALAAWTGPAVLVGDFNFRPDTPPYELLSDDWDDAARMVGTEEPTMGAHRPREERKARIDFIWVRKARGLRVRSLEVMEEPIASDHLPVLAVLEQIPEDSTIPRAP